MIREESNRSTLSANHMTWCPSESVVEWHTYAFFIRLLFTSRRFVLGGSCLLERSLISDLVFEDEALQHAASVPILPMPRVIRGHRNDGHPGALADRAKFVPLWYPTAWNGCANYVCTAPCQVHRTVPKRSLILHFREIPIRPPVSNQRSVPKTKLNRL